jgi:tetratricopeptide (TPR) repeat protein
VARTTSGGYIAYQCKHHKQFSPPEVSAAVTAFLAGSWADRAGRFVLYTTAETAPTRVADEIEKQAQRLRRRTPSVEFCVYGRAELSAILKRHPDLVRDFFGAQALDQFVPGAVSSLSEEKLDTMLELLTQQQASRQVMLISLDWATESLKEELEELSNSRPELFQKIADLGTPPNPLQITAVVNAPPQWLAGDEGRLWDLIARLAQSIGEWRDAVTAWQNAAARQNDDDRMRSLIYGSAAAGVGNDLEGAARMRAEATAINPNHPRLLLDKVSYDLPGRDALRALNGILAEHPEDRALVSGRKVLACMLIPDLEQAREHLADIESHAKTRAMMTRMLRVNLAVHEGRVSVMNGTPMDATALRRAADDGLALRDRLLSQRRWSEAARCLMLAADAVGLLGERDEASEILGRAGDEEIRSDDAAIVLGESANRAMDPHLALHFTEHANRAHPNVRLIRAQAVGEIGTPTERREALRTIEEIAGMDLRISEEAAFYRLSCTFGGDHADWHEPSYQRLLQTKVRIAVDMRVFYLAERHAAYDEADALLKPHLDELWAKVTRTRLAQRWGRQSVLKEAAADLLAAGPNQRFRLEAGRAFEQADDLSRAKEVLVSVARDPSAPATVRADAYARLVRVVGERMHDWLLARKLLLEWTEVRPGDERASTIAPTIFSRLRSSTPGS